MVGHADERPGAPAGDGILQIHWSFPPTTGGVESHVAGFAEALTRRGCRVVVLTGEQRPSRSDRYPIVTTPLLELEAIKSGNIPEGEYLALFQRLLRDVISDHHIRVVHGHNLHHFHAAPAIAIETVRKRMGLRVFHTFHETWPDLLRDRPVYQSWSANYAVSRHVQVQCEASLGFLPTLLPLGVDTNLFSCDTESFASGRPPVILHPARLLPWKGVDIGIRALRILIDRGFAATLLITDTQRIADWNDELAVYREYISGLIGELSLSSCVRFVESSYADMPRLYQGADIVIYPTVGEEPYGLVPIEAMSSGRPIIASRSGGIPETVIDGATGFIVARGDAHGLADRLAELISNPLLARELGRAGRRHARENFDLCAYVSAILRDFEKD